MGLEAKSITAEALFRAAYTACPGDPRPLLLDVRPYSAFKKGHAIHAYCIRLSADGGALLDYSQNSYDPGWSRDCWCVVVGCVCGDCVLCLWRLCVPGLR